MIAAVLAALLGVAALYILILGLRQSRRQDRSHEKFTVLADLLEAAYGGKHVEEEPEAGTSGRETPRRNGERR